MLKAVIKDGGIYTIVNLLTKGFSFLLLPFYTHTFLKSTVGIIDVLSVFGLFITSILCLQLNQGMGRFVADPEQEDSAKVSYASTAIWFTTLMYLVFGVLLIASSSVFINLLSSDVVVPKSTFIYAVCGICLTGIVYFIGVYFRFIRQIKSFALTSFLHGFLTTGLIFLLVLEFDMGLDGVYVAPIISSPIVILIQLFLLRNKLKFTINGVKLKELFYYSLPLIPASIAYVILNFTDRLFIKEYLSFDDLGVYGIGSKFSVILQVVILGISAALGPIAFEQMGNKKVKEQLSRIFRLFISAGSFGVLVLSLFSFETLYVFTNEDYFAAASLMPIFYTSIFIGGFSMFSIGLHIEKKTKLIGIVVVCSSLLNIGLNYILIRHFQLEGASFATLISVCINNFILFFVAQKHYPIKFETKRIAMLLFMMVSLIYLGNYFLPKMELLYAWSLLIKFCLIIIFSFYLYLSGLVNFRRLRIK